VPAAGHTVQLGAVLRPQRTSACYRHPAPVARRRALSRDDLARFSPQAGVSEEPKQQNSSASLQHANATGTAASVAAAEAAAVGRDGAAGRPVSSPPAQRQGLATAGTSAASHPQAPGQLPSLGDLGARQLPAIAAPDRAPGPAAALAQLPMHLPLSQWAAAAGGYAPRAPQAPQGGAWLDRDEASYQRQAAAVQNLRVLQAMAAARASSSAARAAIPARPNSAPDPPDEGWPGGGAGALQGGRLGQLGRPHSGSLSASDLSMAGSWGLTGAPAGALPVPPRALPAQPVPAGVGGMSLSPGAAGLGGLSPRLASGSPYTGSMAYQLQPPPGQSSSFEGTGGGPAEPSWAV
jgi:hypothetical protein